MKLDADLEIINNIAASRGYKNGKNQTFYSQLSFAKDQSAGRHYLIVNNTKKPTADKFRLSNNIEAMHCRFVNEGKATIVLKEPNFSLAIKKANVNQLKMFLKIVHLAGQSANISDELDKLKLKPGTSSCADVVMEDVSNNSTKENKPNSKDQANTKLKKPTTTLTIKSRSEYMSNFRAVISQNLKIKTTIGTVNSFAANLVKLTINNAELKRIDPSIFELENLNYLDMSNNKLTTLDNFSFKKLEELNLSHNEIDSIGKMIHLPKLINLDLNTNKLIKIDGSFCNNFKTLSKLNLSNNYLKYINCNFGYKIFYLKFLYMSGNQLSSLPYSMSHLRLEMLELHDNPFEYTLIVPNLNISHKKFPTLVEICSRFVINKKIKYKIGDIPLTLISYLDTSAKCVCGQVSFDYKFNVTTMFELNRISQSFTYLTINGISNNQVPLDMILCSWACYRRNNKFKSVA